MDAGTGSPPCAPTDDCVIDLRGASRCPGKERPVTGEREGGWVTVSDQNQNSNGDGQTACVTRRSFPSLFPA